MINNKAYCFAFIGAIVALATYRYSIYSKKGEVEQIASLLTKNFEKQISHYKKISVGTNANIDLIVSGVALLNKLGILPPKYGKHCSEIDSLDVLGECFMYFMSKGAAGERPIATQQLNAEIVHAASLIENSQNFIGGNAALVGLKFSKLIPSAKVMLCGPVGPNLKLLLPNEVFVPKSCEVQEDENHLILEYQRNERWGAVKAPIANRFIMSHDVANAALSTLESFIEETLMFKPDLIIVSGFHLLDNQNEEFWQQRLQSAAAGFSRLPLDVPVHLELASMSHCPVIIALVEQLFPLVNSIGLNEQELGFITRCLRGVHADRTEVAKKDEIGFFSDVISWIMMKYGKNDQLNPNSRLTRIHFHCLYVHILAVAPAYWSSNEASVSRGSWTAYSQACDSEEVNDNVAELKMPREFSISLQSGSSVEFKFDSPLTVVSGSEDINLYISPVLVCKRPLKTVGLGDAISASGLLYNDFKQSIT